MFIILYFKADESWLSTSGILEVNCKSIIKLTRRSS